MNAIKFCITTASSHSQSLQAIRNNVLRRCPRAQLRKPPTNPSKKTSIRKPIAATLLAAPAFFIPAQSVYSDEDKENELPALPSPLLSPTRSVLKNSGSQILLHSSLNNICDTRLCVGSSVIPHPAKRAKGGEDAYFVSDDHKVIGIADGVGGWGDIGVDPALYSRSLMEGARLASEDGYSMEPVSIMSEAYDYASDVQGSSTCCVVVLDGFTLKAANLGDSGFIVLRDNQIVYRTKEQQHSFNFPYQIGTASSDRPEHAVRISIDIQPGDLIIMGTDGLFDNLFDEEIIELASKSTEPATISQLIARQAHIVANSRTVISPFAKAARENGYPLCTGGKLDDITVVVARVVLNSDISMAA